MWSGDWGPTADHRNLVSLELKWDGVNLSGSVNPGPAAVQLSKSSFESGTGTLMMETHVRGRDGNLVHYVIQGKVEGNTITGTWNHDKQRGDFKMQRKSELPKEGLDS
jgi:hypothetical protein